MARSRKKRPFASQYCADSDRVFKRIWHKRERLSAKSRIRRGLDPLNYRSVGDLWISQKEGKARFDPVLRPNLLRK